LLDFDRVFRTAGDSALRPAVMVACRHTALTCCSAGNSCVLLRTLSSGTDCARSRRRLVSIDERAFGLA